MTLALLNMNYGARRNPLSHRHDYDRYICLGRILGYSQDCSFYNLFQYGRITTGHSQVLRLKKATHTLSNQPKRPFISTVNTRGTVVARTILDQLARQHIEKRTRMTNRTMRVIASGRSITGRWNTESKSWRVRAGKIPIECCRCARRGAGMKN
jgi:hypothetical protein